MPLETTKLAPKRSSKKRKAKIQGNGVVALDQNGEAMIDMKDGKPSEVAGANGDTAIPMTVRIGMIGCISSPRLRLIWDTGSSY